MAVVNKAYKFRIYPSDTQVVMLNKTVGCARVIWNQLLSKNINGYKEHGKDWTNTFDTKSVKDKEELRWLNEVSAAALQQKSRDLMQTYQQYFKSMSGKRKVKIGKPKFKVKRTGGSFRLPNQKFSIDQETKKIRLEKIGKVDYVADRCIPADVKFISVTITKTQTGKLFASVLVEENVKLLPPTGKSVGVDLGIKDLMILSDGKKIINPKYFRENQAKISRLQYLGRHKIAPNRKKNIKASNNYKRLQTKIAKLHERIANQRTDYLHKATTNLIQNYDIICIEDLNVAGMLKNHKLAKSIADCSFGNLVRMLEYKASWYGRTIVKVNRWFPSSKLCNSCGHKNTELTLKDREWECPVCGSHHNRDENAAINILNEGVKILSGELLD